MELPLLLGGALALGSIFGWAAFLRLNALEEKIFRLSQEMEALRAGAIGKVAAQFDSRRSRPSAPEPAAGSLGPAPPPAAPQSEPAPMAFAPARPIAETAAATLREESQAGQTPRMTPDGVQLFMRSLSKNWLIWLGGLALAFGGAFLLKSAIDAGMFGPPMRIAATLALGGAMIYGADRLAKARDNERSLPEAWRESAAPAALAGAGGSAVYGAIYAAYGLYALIPSVIALALLAAASAGMIALAMRHRAQGLVALAFAGAHLTPLLAASGQAHVAPLLVYVLGVTAAGLVVVRRMNWGPVSLAVIAGGLAWPLLLVLSVSRPDVSVYIYLPAFAALIGALAWKDAGRPFAAWTALQGGECDAPTALNSAPAALVGALGAGLLLTARAPDAAASVIMWAAFSILTVAAARFRQAFSFAPLPTAAALVLATATGGEAISDWRTSLVFAVLFGAGGFAAMHGVAEKARLASVAGVTPAALIAVQYWLGAGAPTFALAVATIVIVVGNVAMIAALADSENGFDQNPGAISAFVVGASSATALAAIMTLNGMSLSVALAAQAPVLALLWSRFQLPALKYCAAALGVVASARLLLLPEIFRYDVGAAPLLNLLLVAYLAPAAAFWLSARAFERGGLNSASRVVQALEGGAMALFSAFITLEIRHMLNGGDLSAPHFSLTEASLQTMSWLSIAAFMRWRFGGALSAIRRLAEMTLLCAAAAMTFFYLLLFANPMFGLDPEPVGGLPVVNMLVLYYLAPALGFAAAAYAARRSGVIAQSRIVGSIAALVAATWLTLAVRQIFHAPDLSRGGFGLHESATLAAAWAFAAAAVGYRFLQAGRPVAGWTFRFLLALSAAATAIFPLMAANPWWGPNAVAIGGPVLFNMLIVDYLAPALGFAAAAWAAGRRDARRISHLAAYFAAFLGLIWITFVVRHVFHTPQLDKGLIGVAESWGYSAAIMVYAAGLLIAGALRRYRLVSTAGFGALMLAAVKVFVFDMAGLEGIWRASAFLGLGAALIGIAVLYQRTAAATKLSES